MSQITSLYCRPRCGFPGICNEICFEWFVAIWQSVTPEVIVHSDATAGNVPVGEKKKPSNVCSSAETHWCFVCPRLNIPRWHSRDSEQQQSRTNTMKSQTVIILIIHHGSSIISLLLHIKIISAEALGSGNIIFHLSYYRKKSTNIQTVTTWLKVKG